MSQPILQQVKNQNKQGGIHVLHRGSRDLSRAGEWAG
jgi:hypothetical protein